MSLRFLKALLERAVKTFCQSLATMLGTGAVGILEIGWKQALSVSATMTVLSILTSVGSARLSGDPESPSLVVGDK